ncbi:MAG: Lrp/AsnC family transcriptional regulator [Rhizomicrobium sp.]
MLSRLDAIALEQLDVPQHDCSPSAAELADRVGLSQSPC